MCYGGASLQRAALNHHERRIHNLSSWRKGSSQVCFSESMVYKYSRDNSGILVKLIVFTVMLGVVPIGSYFGTLNRVWHGMSLYFFLST